MKKTFLLASVAAMFVFSALANATGTAVDSLEQAGTNDLWVWALVGLGLLCFIELRKQSLDE